MEQLMNVIFIITIWALMYLIGTNVKKGQEDKIFSDFKIDRDKNE